MEASNFIGSIILNFQKGGFFMYPIAITFAVAIAMVFERMMRLYVQYNVDGTSFMFEVQKHVLANDLDGAIRA